MLKGAELCSCEDDKRTLPDTPLPLASVHEHPNKDLIPFSRYKIDLFISLLTLHMDFIMIHNDNYGVVGGY